MKIKLDNVDARSIEMIDAINEVKKSFEEKFEKNLNVTKVPSPLFLDPKSGLNDTLNGIERAVSFTPKVLQNQELQVIHSLAKWKRKILGDYKFKDLTGLYTNMKAIRQDEDLSHLHSLYVEQWDWEIKIPKEKRNKEFLKEIVMKIYNVILEVEQDILNKYEFEIENTLPDNIHFITSEQLLNLYPTLDAKQRENAIAKKYGAVFIMEIGDILSNGQKHDGRAPDYDDWELNGDIIVWNEVLQSAVELSSMGIRVCKHSLQNQVEKTQNTELLDLDFHKNVLEEKVPYTIGGGIGESRLIMHLLRRKHIGEVQFTVWDDNTKEICKEEKINLK